MVNFDSVAPYLKDPLVLAGFAIFLFFSLARYLVEQGIVPPLGKAHGYRIIQAILVYGFVLGLVVILLGFGLKYRALSESEQDRAIALLRAELSTNEELVGQLARNLETFVTVYDTVSRCVRDERIPILHGLFPDKNLRREFTNPSPSEVATEAINDIAARRLDQNRTALRQADAAGRLIYATVERTRITLASLADPEHRRYVVRDEGYRAQVGILRRIDAVDVTGVESAYAALGRVRSNYDVVATHLREYLDAVQEFFRPGDSEITVVSLTKVLTAERLAVSTLMAFTPDLVAAGETIKRQSEKLGKPTDRPSS